MDSTVTGIESELEKINSLTSYKFCLYFCLILVALIYYYSSLSNALAAIETIAFRLDGTWHAWQLTQREKFPEINKTGFQLMTINKL